MEFRTLRAFVEVVRQGGFSPAAKVVFATQSTVSKAVRQLEQEIGLPLLDRLGHRVAPTAAGEIVYRRAVRLLAERDDLGAELAELRGLRRGTLRLGLPPIGSSVLFAPLVAAYRQRHPEIEIRLVEHGSERLEELLEAGEIDFAGLLTPIAPAFAQQPVRSEPVMALLAPDHPLAGRPAVRLGDLRDTPFILFESGFALNRIILDACRRDGFEPTVVARSSQIDFIAGLAGAGLGVAFLPRMIAMQRTEVPIGLVLLDAPGTDWTMAMAWRRDAWLPPAGAAWLALLRETWKDDAA
ncbi:LysR family transcriptional regulator [Rhodoplanes sp. TEM]|uniref:LysR family transcriptional regulator n=1 Tax=Rhodoplanes tepidamans TaxID=200616 RepID=A0ABT5JHR2_RHOTP|nr:MULTISPECIES: LysR family transcriptional regulator [Rhodoplanes]MDC7789235.1 LysR family transcriptional regulator [Rhodoplanes tepidamans]MDC7985827.1 LysR family transcriptional regulator [Rhodoplanes sp. TEM]MDQ0358846.1 DNA-binding transcriptional LysR family regulator [Rhodoplanes tepidamans]